MISFLLYEAQSNRRCFALFKFQERRVICSATLLGQRPPRM